jgi:hypothetical protein
LDIPIERGFKMIIVGIIGKAYSGKSTIGKYILNDLRKGFVQLSFAERLKKMCINAGLLTYEECYVEKTAHSREILQKVGTDLFRNQVDPDYWVKQIQPTYDIFLSSGIENFVIDDVRFPNESKWIHSYPYGITVKVIREGYVNELAGSSHPTESKQDEIVADYTISAKSGEIDKLKNAMFSILVDRGIILFN